jgi:hypothetical protein
MGDLALTSQKQIEANRRNAQKSTGPKSTEGKAIVRLNAVKHGILAQDVVIRAGDGQENWEEFEDLVSSLRDYYQPEGPVEEALTGRIATSLWRMHRVQRAEQGAIRRVIDTLVARTLRTREDEFHRNVRAINQIDDSMDLILSGSGLPTNGEQAQRGLRRSSLGLQFLIDELKGLRETVSDEKHVPHLVSRRLARLLGTDPGALVVRIRNLLPDEEESEDEWDEEESDDEWDEDYSVTPLATEQLQQVLQLIDDEIEVLEREKVEEDEREALELDALRARLAVPPAEESELLLRYETTYERQFYKAMNELERLQARRRGDAAPTINIDMSQN